MENPEALLSGEDGLKSECDIKKNECSWELLETVANEQERSIEQLV